MPTGQLEI
ncbi:uncharacterized protein FFB14_11976 [Fusarium fujikuroi]|nr:uncharacterized protein FFB14_11976 [Fusarium fujikuroi]